MHPSGSSKNECDKSDLYYMSTEIQIVSELSPEDIDKSGNDLAW